MSKVEYREFSLENIIDFNKSITNGSEFTKSLINKNKGSIPVYGASNDENEVSYGYVKDNLIIKPKNNSKPKKIKYFENCLTWNIDGSVAIFYRKGRFSLSEKVIPLIPYDNIIDKIDLYYLKYVIINSKEYSDFGFSNKAGKNKLKKIKVKFPVDENGNFNIDEQINISQKYRKVEEYKYKLLNKKNEIERINVKFEKKYKFINVKITDLFKPSPGQGKFTKSYCLKNRGEYPVYSGSTNDIFAYINEYVYDGDYLSWVKDGLAGYLMHNRGKFSITNHRGILLPITDLSNIDLDYIIYVLEPIFRNHIKGRLAKGEKNEYTTLSKEMINDIKETIPVPISDNGDYDLKAQQEISKKIKSISNLKNEVIRKLDELIDTNVYFYDN